MAKIFLVSDFGHTEVYSAVLNYNYDYLVVAVVVHLRKESMLHQGFSVLKPKIRVHQFT